MGERAHCEGRDKIGMWVSLALDGRLDPIQEAEMQQHLASCPACRADANAVRRVSALLEAMPMIAPAFGFSLRVERRLADRSTQRRHVLRGMALLTSSLSVIGVGAAVIFILGMGLAALLWLGSEPAWQQAGLSMPQVVSGLGLVGKGASLFLKDILLRYGLPVVLAVGVGLAVMGGLWAWLVSRKSKSHRNGYA